MSPLDDLFIFWPKKNSSREMADIRSSDSTTIIEEDSLRDSDVRYLAYAQRVTRALTASSRYLAFSSDVGEAFRPVVSPRMVTFSYALTWGYVFSDVAYNAYMARKLHPGNVAFLQDRTARAASFQLIGSVALPFIIIHSGVKYSSKIFDQVAPKIRLLRAWGPSAVGLAIIPLLPTFVDHPVEQAVDYAFKRWNPFNLDAKLVEMHHHKSE